MQAKYKSDVYLVYVFKIYQNHPIWLEKLNSDGLKRRKIQMTNNRSWMVKKDRND